MRLINYKMTVRYEGTRYRGWQKQPGVENTIQGKLETLLTRLMGTKIEVYGAGRTDAGVHSMGQTASFRVPAENLRRMALNWQKPGAGQSAEQILESSVEQPSGSSGKQPLEASVGLCPEPFRGQLGKSASTSSASSSREPEGDILLPSRLREAEDRALFQALNHYLPEDIAAAKLLRASDRFHARYLTSSKWYQYVIRTSEVSDVRNRRFLWQYGAKLDTDLMREGAKALVGCHDYASFCGLKMKKSTVRTVSSITISEPDEDTIVLDYCGDGFLNHMVRLMTGELVEVGAGRLEPGEIGKILAMKKKGAASHTAPASGLTLMEVRY